MSAPRHKNSYLFRQDIYDGMILNVVDITSIVSSHKQTAQDHRHKNDYFLEICDNMRTPLEGMLAILDQTLDSDLSEEQRILLEMVKECGKTLGNLVHEVGATQD